MCGYGVIGRHHLHNLKCWWCKGAGFGHVQGSRTAPGVVWGYPEELPMGEQPSGCEPALVLPPPNLSKSWCPLSLHADERHDWREDWQDTLRYLLWLPRWQRLQKTPHGDGAWEKERCMMWGWGCGAVRWCEGRGVVSVPCQVSPLPYLRQGGWGMEEQGEGGRGEWKVEEGKGYKRRANSGRRGWRLKEKGEGWKRRLKGRKWRWNMEEDGDGWKRKVKGRRGERRMEKEVEGWQRMLKQLCCPSYLCVILAAGNPSSCHVPV